MKLFPLLFILFFFANCSFDGHSPFAANAMAPGSELRQIEVYAKQFSWTVRYAGIDNVLGNSSYKLITENNPLGLDSTDVTGYDDVIVADTFFLIKNDEAELQLKSRDVIHSLYLPQLKIQMNAVPGITTTLKVKPEHTTAEMRSGLNDPEFDYVLLCNKICGPGHYDMKMKVVVGTQEEFHAWMNRHQPFFAGKKLPVKVQEEGDGK